MRRPSMPTAFVLCTALLVGCSSEKAPPAAVSGDEHAGHSTAGADAHAGHTMVAMRSILMVENDAAMISPGNLVILKLMIHAPDGKPVSRFEPIHEKLVHLIIVREGLDQFAHIHPTTTADGTLTAEYTFPVAGEYHLFADHKPAGKGQALATAKLQIGGDAPAAEALATNAPGDIAVEGIHAAVTLGEARAGSETKIGFTLRDEQHEPLGDLEPYLGAMGHLVILSADAGEYVHAHPANDSETSAASGRVEFEAHFAKPGLYKAWGQFQRGGKIVTVPFVMKVE